MVSTFFTEITVDEQASVSGGFGIGNQSAYAGGAENRGNKVKNITNVHQSLYITGYSVNGDVTVGASLTSVIGVSSLNSTPTALTLK